ncbi:MAG: hypothetical protein J7L73_09425 [Anaerolineales bacterium]|nr:hypothetical protein [Anaerolineales bacterium]
MKLQDRQLYEHLAFLYGEEMAKSLTPRLLSRLNQFKAQFPYLAHPLQDQRVSERDTILITYGDMVQREGEKPLQTLAYFLEKYLVGTINTIHILPFFPFSSDDGFSVVDYRKVNPALGTWNDVRRIGKHFRLMFDAVINHISAESEWFQEFLKGTPRFRDFFTVMEEGTDLSSVFRPRAKPVLTSFETAAGRKLVWTTFSKDQIDLNYHNPEVLLEVIDVLLDYVSHGAEFIRLDAVTFIWKEVGTSCINLPQTHCIVQLIRLVLNIVAPMVTLITETNVPHKENLMYFGNGQNEAQMVYNFALPVLVLHAFHHENVNILSEWASTLDLPSNQATFFNFLAGHDGIGILPVRDILSESDIKEMIVRTKASGGEVSYKNNQDGSQSPYELNINYMDALNSLGDSKISNQLKVKRFLTSQAIMLALRGIPGIYFHSLVGSHNWIEGVNLTGRKRTINREKIHIEHLEKELNDPHSVRHQIFYGYTELIQKRIMEKAFHPNGGQVIIPVGETVFALMRISPEGNERVLCLHNVSAKEQRFVVSNGEIDLPKRGLVHDLVSGLDIEIENHTLHLTFQPFQVMWLKWGQKSEAK